MVTIMKKTKNLKTRVRLFTNMGWNTFFTEHIRATAAASSK